jgi:hypothetical protein
LKEIIILYCAKYLSNKLRNENFNISIGVFSLQGNPTLLVSWMVCTIVLLFAGTVLYIVHAALYFAIKDIAGGAGEIVGVLINDCK